MRNANEKSEAKQDGTLRATFEVPRSLADEFRAVAKRNERTLSSELRRLMRETVDAARDGGS